MHLPLDLISAVLPILLLLFSLLPTSVAERNYELRDATFVGVAAQVIPSRNVTRNDDAPLNVTVRNSTFSLGAQLVVNVTELLADSIVLRAESLRRQRIVGRHTDPTKLVGRWNADVIVVTIENCTFSDDASLLVVADDEASVLKAAQRLALPPYNLDNIVDQNTTTQAQLTAWRLRPAGLVVRIRHSTFTTSSIVIDRFVVSNTTIAAFDISECRFVTLRAINKDVRSVQSQYTDRSSLNVSLIAVGEVRLSGQLALFGVSRCFIQCFMTTGALPQTSCGSIEFNGRVAIDSGASMLIAATNFSSFSPSRARVIAFVNAPIRVSGTSVLSIGAGNLFEVSTIGAAECVALAFAASSLLIEGGGSFRVERNRFNVNCAFSASWVAGVEFGSGSPVTCRDLRTTIVLRSNVVVALRASGSAAPPNLFAFNDGTFSTTRGDGHLTMSGGCSLVLADTTFSASPASQHLVSGAWDAPFSDASVSWRCNIVNGVVNNDLQLWPRGVGGSPRMYVGNKVSCNSCLLNGDCIGANAQSASFNVLSNECECACAVGVSPICSDGLQSPVAQLPLLPGGESTNPVYNGTIPDRTRTPTVSRPPVMTSTLRMIPGSPTSSAVGASVAVLSTHSPSFTGTSSPSTTPRLFPASAKNKTIQELRESYPGCPVAGEELRYTVSHINATAFLDVNALKTRSTTVEIRLQSCHWFNGSLTIAAGSVFPREIRETVLLGTGVTILEQLAGFDGFVRQAIVAGGKVLSLSLGPMPEYVYVGPDGVFFVANFTNADLVVPRPLERRLANGSTHESLTVSFVVQEPETSPAKDATVATAVGGATASIGIGGALFGMPAMAGTAQRQALLNNVAECPRALENEPLSAELHPLRFSLSGDFGRFRYHLSAMVGNLILIAAVFAVHFIVACAVALAKQVPLTVGLAWSRFPGRSFPVTALMMQGALSTAITVAMLTESLALSLICGLSAAFVVLTCAAPCFILLRRKDGFGARYSPKVLEDRTPLALLTMNRGIWVPRRASSESFLRMYGCLFEDLLPGGSARLFVIDTLVMLLSSFMLALVPDTEQRCTVMFASVVGVFVLYALLIVATRPFSAMINNALFVATSAAQAGSAAALFVAFRQNSQAALDVSEGLNMFLVALQIAATVFSFAKAFVDWRADDLQPDKSIRAEAERLAELRHDLMASLAANIASVAPRGREVQLLLL